MLNGWLGPTLRVDRLCILDTVSKWELATHVKVSSGTRWLCRSIKELVLEMRLWITQRLASQGWGSQ